MHAIPRPNHRRLNVLRIRKREKVLKLHVDFLNQEMCPKHRMRIGTTKFVVLVISPGGSSKILVHHLHLVLISGGRRTLHNHPSRSQFLLGWMCLEWM